MESIFAVIDTNVLVSGLISPNGYPARIVELLRSGEVRMVLDDRILCEYAEVLKRPAFGFPENEIDIFLERLLSFAVYAEIGRKSIIVDMQDSGDIPFAECAISFGCPIVTGNQKHFKHEKLMKVMILSPADFIGYIRV